jgi:hypothetical protein
MVSRYSGPKIVNGRLSQIGECFWQVYANRKRRSAVFLCECGKKIIAVHDKVNNGKISSCGCRKKEANVSNRLTHGATSKVTNGTHLRTRAYSIWGKMIQRCRNPKNPKFACYGGRGISVCQKWMSFEGFLEDMGSPPNGMSIDRIDVNRGYCKENCRWATNKEQANNRTTNVWVEVEGQNITLKEAANMYAVSYKRLWKYVRVKHMSLTEAVNRCKRP